MVLEVVCVRAHGLRSVCACHGAWTGYVCDAWFKVCTCATRMV